jgi:hypothetical protein
MTITYDEAGVTYDDPRYTHDGITLAPSNASTDRAYDADSTSLIADLKLAGIIG